MTEQVAETFTGTNGAAWPTANWKAGVTQVSGGATGATIQGNRGRIQAGTGYSAVRVFSTLTAAATAREVYVEVTPSAVTEHTIYVVVRDDTTATSAYFPNGYFVAINPLGGQWSILAGYGTGTYGNAAPVTRTFTAGNTYGVRVRVSGYTVTAKVWNITANETEPQAWTSTWTDTDSAWASGAPALSVISGNTTNPYAEFDNFRATDGAAGGGLMVWDGAKWVRRPVKVWNGTAWVRRPTKVRTAAGAWATTP